MKWILLALILISCQDNSDEEMRIISANINPGDGPIVSVDGGQCIFLTPDASGGEVGHGFTCTGLYFDGWQPNGNPRFWVGNDGRDREPGAGGIDPQDFKASVVLIELDYSANAGLTLPATVYAVKKRELLTESLNDSTCQGVAQANDSTIWFVSGGNIININETPNGVAVENKRFSVSGANGMAYDKTDDTLLIHDGSGIVKRYSNTGTLIDSNVISISTATDQMSLDRLDNDVLYTTSGSNGGSMSVTKRSISRAFSNTTQGIATATAAEGCSVVTRPSDGTRYLYVSSDAWYHQGSQPSDDYKINSIQKVTTSF